ncbi:MAG: hypothetical protein K2L67_06325 [Clostridia bacterium]|nr:hypothetical protein [Clostridia bacterium]
MSFVNRLKKVTISSFCALAVFAGFALAADLPRGNFAAFAEETAAVTDYPAEFIKHASEGFESIFDYAVSGNTFAFAEGSVISVIENGKERVDCKTDSTVTALDCDQSGKFFYKNGSGATFALETKQPATHEFQELDIEGVYVGNFNYYKDAHGDNYVFNKSEGGAAVKLEGFEKVKKYGESVYALKEGKFFKFNGATAEDASGEITYTDLSAVKSVCFGDTAQSLKTLNSDSLHFVALNAGEHAYVTEVDLNLISDNPQDTFLPNVLTNDDAAKRTFKIGAANGPAAGKEAMLLAVSGNTYVVAADGVCYIMNKANAGEPFKRAFAAVTKPVMRVAVDRARMYSAPFVCEGAFAASLPKNATVKVLGKVEAQGLFVIEYQAENGETVKGFTPFGYLSEHNAPIEGDPPATNDPNYNEDSPAVTVVLIIAVIALVMIALGYLTYIATASKQKEKRKKQKPDSSSTPPDKN